MRALRQYCRVSLPTGEQFGEVNNLANSTSRNAVRPCAPAGGSWRGGHREAQRRLAALTVLVHCRVGRLQIAREALLVE
jgi:hypothetical protein